MHSGQIFMSIRLEINGQKWELAQCAQGVFWESDLS